MESGLPVSPVFAVETKFDFIAINGVRMEAVTFPPVPGRSLLPSSNPENGGRTSSLEKGKHIMMFKLGVVQGHGLGKWSQKAETWPDTLAHRDALPSACWFPGRICQRRKGTHVKRAAQ